MRVVVVCLLGPMLLGATPLPGPLPNDHVPVLAEKWSCRTLRGAETHKTGTRTGDRIDVVNEAVPAGEPPYVLNGLYGYDPVIAQRSRHAP